MAPATTYEMETDHLLALVERMQQAGHTERQISIALARSLRPRRTWSQRLRAAGRRIAGTGTSPAGGRPAVA